MDTRLWLICCLLLQGVATLLRAEQFGIYTYTVTPQNTIAISRVAIDASGAIIIPSTISGKTVTDIWSYALHSCTGITSVSLPPSLTSIGDWAFLYCRSLTSITCPPTLLSIGNWAFYDCTRLSSLDLPPFLNSIGRGAFFGCVSLDDIILPPALSSIGDRAFQRCTGLSSITIPASVTSIGSGVFSSCSALGSVKVHPDSQTYSSIGGVLFDKAQTTLITVPSGYGGFYKIPSKVIAIAASAFEGCRQLDGIILPSSLTSIPDAAFSSCAGLTFFSASSQNPTYSTINGVLFNKSGTTLIAFPVGSGGAYAIPGGVTSIGDSAFSLAFNLTSVTCPASLASIGNSAFYACTGLTGITFPGTVNSIGNFAFSFCSGLSNLTFPASITSVGKEAFSSCRNLSSIAFLGDSPGGLILTEIATPLPATYTTYWLGSKAGFSAPTWQGYPAVRIDEAVYPAASWLLKNDLSHDTGLHQDPDGDGVSLLMAYALNLDPRLNLGASLPVPVLHPDRLSLTFHAAAAGITYQVETSTGLDEWTTGGVTLSPLGVDQRRTVSVPRSGPARYLRLKVAGGS